MKTQFATCPVCGGRVRIERVDVHGVWLGRHHMSRKLRTYCRGARSPLVPEPASPSEKAQAQAWEAAALARGGAA